MAPPSPRRSSRARTQNSQSQQSSVSSGASGRIERNTRSVNKPSSGKSTPSASLSSEPLDDLDDTLLGRRRKRGHDEELERSALNELSDAAIEADDVQDEEDEAVRCICGSEEYPGRPPVDGPDADFFTSIELTDDVTGFFVQCDVCKVWQHGACVGIFSAESSPDEYFCEQCRKDLHKIHSASNGQKYSKYLPLTRPSRPTSRATSITAAGARSPKLGNSKAARPNVISQTSKRRSTMNSRDAAYDDEQLRRAIEASKEENAYEPVETISRRTKRGRSDSEENSAQPKRQQTNSRSTSPVVDEIETFGREDFDDETQSRQNLKSARQGRHHERPEQDEKERLRQDNVMKRKGRAERRRTEESDISEELPLAISKVTVNKSVEVSHIEPVPLPMPVPGTPPTIHSMAPHPQKRSSRSTHKRGRGRNQYTKDRVGDDDDSPPRSMSRDVGKTAEESITSSSGKPASDSKHAPKAKPNGTYKMSILDMKRRVAAIMDFISKTQIDLAAEASFYRCTTTTDMASSTQDSSAIPANGTSRGERDLNLVLGAFDARNFRELSCIEMMDVLTRDMVKWQNQYS